MKFLYFTLFILVSMLTFKSIAQNVGVNETGALPDDSALLDLSSTDKGFLITRVDTANIASPVFGLMTFSPIDSCLYLFGGETWSSLGGSGKKCASNYSSPPTLPSCDADNITKVIDVINPSTGKAWMDRNLGADRVATSRDDVAAYGDLYQWGRCIDGHEKRNSGETTTLSPKDIAGHDNFILSPSSPYDWLNLQNDNLWQGVTGANNPCPKGYRLPTEPELEAERLSWGNNNSNGAFASPLKLTVAGSRRNDDGKLHLVGSFGRYWSSTIDGVYVRYLHFYNTHAGMTHNNRANGYSVRCIKD